MDKNSALCSQHPKRDQKCLQFLLWWWETTSTPNICIWESIPLHTPPHPPPWHCPFKIVTKLPSQSWSTSFLTSFFGFSFAKKQSFFSKQIKAYAQHLNYYIESKPKILNRLWYFCFWSEEFLKPTIDNNRETCNAINKIQPQSITIYTDKTVWVERQQWQQQLELTC